MNIGEKNVITNVELIKQIAWELKKVKQSIEVIKPGVVTETFVIKLSNPNIIPRNLIPIKLFRNGLLQEEQEDFIYDIVDGVYNIIWDYAIMIEEKIEAEVKQIQ